MMSLIDQILNQLTLDEQAQLLSGADFWQTADIDRLNLPAIKLTDGPNGARGSKFQDGATTACFPVGIALGATWNTALAREMGAALAEEAKLKGAHVLLAPTVNLQRTALNGRNFECYSEDPWLTAELGAAVVRGIQGQGVAATIKHFVGNESEFQRMSISSDIPERALRELYLLPFEHAVKEAGVMAVMTAYNRIDKVFAADHRRLVQQVLRDEWGFDGLVMTDWFASHDTVNSVVAGTDLEMPGPSRQRGQALVQAVQDGRLPAAAVTACARRVLQLIERVRGLHRAQGADQALLERSDNVPAHRELIRKIGSEAAVLLKNDGSVLPLALQSGQTVAVIGRAATEPQIMGGGSSTVNAHYRVAPLDALVAQLPEVKFSHHHGADLHRWLPPIQAPMSLAYYNHPEFGGPVVHQATIGSTEQLWIDSLNQAVDPQTFSVRGQVRFVAEVSGLHQFSLISAGLSRAFINGEPLLDAWQGWRASGNYFGFGCDEVLASRELQAGEVCDLTVEYSTQTPEPLALRAFRLGVHRPLGEADIVQAVEAARQADVALVFAGLNSEWDSEGLDRTSLDLPHLQNELIARVAAANPRTVVVLQTGSPVLLPWLPLVPAVLQAWYPGQECGNAIADVLLGRADPGGRLTQTWPLRMQDGVAMDGPQAYPGVDGHAHYDEGVFIGYRHFERGGITPQFSFGHGLSYTQFELGDLVIDHTTVAPGQTLTATVTVRNVGQRSGQHVLQLYVRPGACKVARPPQELKAFAKVCLAPGETAQVRLPLTMRSLAYFDESRSAWVAEAGAYQLRCGASSQSQAVSASVVLTADWVHEVNQAPARS